ncbi:Bacterial regulatory protein, GntR family [Streptomyces sp. YIM 130001]|uniref:GntR family transcriptional regulator YhfZ n=1 Tax=Streptomyces sp. YIM 130001 TaxID=2259644 RepID=UPI000E6467CD|nr:GntR family transcriptional regulator YhfZ [Streptomyces sp. YIM 130001]RII09566.1 Bacterial regulatory protein, GntR family [Streptomyces sp. YIM 130001]
MNGFDDRFLTRNGLTARRLAVLLLHHEPDTRLPRVRDLAQELHVGNGTVQAGLRLLESAGAIETQARGHLGTFLVASDRAILWRLSGLGTLLAAMPLPYSRRYEGLATGLRAAFEQAGAPFAITFMRGATARIGALLEGKVDLVVLSRLAADQLVEEHSVKLIADLGPATYVGAHGLLLRRGATVHDHGLRVAVDHSSRDQVLLAEKAFAGRSDIEWVEASYMQLRDLFAHARADATVWNVDEVQGRLGEELADVLPLGDEVTRELALRNSSAAIVGRANSAAAFQAVREALDLSLITALQSEVLRGERIPSY